jgi:hypothetical protein
MFAKRRQALRSRASKASRFCRPGFETLEDRIVPTPSVPPHFVLNPS